MSSLTKDKTNINAHLDISPSQFCYVIVTKFEKLPRIEIATINKVATFKMLYMDCHCILLFKFSHIMILHLSNDFDCNIYYIFSSFCLVLSL